MTALTARWKADISKTYWDAHQQAHASMGRLHGR
jgi:hypothetical protein